MAGGDYYDMFTAQGDMLIALVGDASGHGLKACMSIMTMHTLVRMLGTTRFDDTAKFVGEINSMLCTNSIVQSGGGFITLLYVAVDTKTHKVSWTSAGHPPALLHRLDTNEVEQIGANSDGGLPLGIADGMPYDAMEFTMPPHSRLLLYSDGLTDAPGAGRGGGRQRLRRQGDHRRAARLPRPRPRRDAGVPFRPVARLHRRPRPARRHVGAFAGARRGRRYSPRPLHSGLSSGTIIPENVNSRNARPRWGSHPVVPAAIRKSAVSLGRLMPREAST